MCGQRSAPGCYPRWWACRRSSSESCPHRRSAWRRGICGAIPRPAANDPRPDPFAPAGGGSSVGHPGIRGNRGASLLTLVEVGGLVAIIVAGVQADLPIATTLANFPPPEFNVLSGIAFAGLLAFFAFIGFEDLA